VIACTPLISSIIEKESVKARTLLQEADIPCVLEQATDTSRPAYPAAVVPDAAAQEVIAQRIGNPCPAVGKAYETISDNCNLM